MKAKNLDYIDFEKVNTLLEGFNKSTGFVTAILDLDGKVLSKSGWRQICTEFHRINPETSEKCTISDTVLAAKLAEGEKYHFYECLNGLVDVAVPIVINGEHIANLFSGQFFFKKPEISFFKKQAAKYGFDEERYIKALEKVPIVSKEKVKTVMDFLLNMTQLISETTFQKLEQTELNKNISESKERFSKIFKASPIAISIAKVSDGNLTDVNYTWCKLMGFSAKEALGHNVEELKIIDTETRNKIREEFLRKGKLTMLECNISTKSGEKKSILVSAEKITIGDELFSINLVTDITERKFAEEALRDSEVRMRNVFEQANDGIYIISAENRYLNANERGLELLGYTLDELLQMDVTNVLSPYEVARLAIEPPRMMSGIPHFAEWEHVRKDGSTFPGEVSARRLNDSSYLAIVRDLSERRQADLKIRESEEKFRLAFDTSPDSIAISRIADGVIVSVNKGFTKISGYSEEEVIGKKSSEINSWKNTEDRRKFVDELMSKGEVRDFEAQLLTKGGEIYGLMSASIIEINDVKHVLGITRDITGRKIAEEKLKENYNLLRIAGEKAKLGGWTVNLQENRSFWSEEVAIIHEMPTGYSPLVDDGINFYAPEWRDKITEVFTRCTQEAVPYDEEMEIITSAGKRIWVRTIGEAIKDDKGKIVKVQGAFQDITERRQAEEKIRKLNEELEQRVRERTSQLEATNKELEAFSYSVSHDLRAPLRHINGFVDLLTENYNDLLPEKARHYLDVIVNSSRQMGALIDDLLEFSRTGRQEMQETVLNMNVVLQEALDSLEHDIEKRKIEWNIATLPNIKGDHSLLRIVWYNLLSNAVKFTKFKDLAQIRIGFNEEEKEYTFFVRDNGAGFDMRFANKLFGVFQRLHTIKEFEGTGIGLANVRRIILKHGGRTWAESQLNEGAAFFFTLPKPKQ